MTSENLPAVRHAADVATADTDSWTAVVADVAKLASHIADTEFVPKGLRGSAPATAAAMLYGREVGLPPMTALNMTHVVEGKPGISAEGMRALVFAAGHEIEFLDSTGAVCSMRARRRGAERWTELTWNLDMARAAGLAGKGNWSKYPRAMLQARCTTELCRMVFPDVIHGFRSVEELEDMTDEPGDQAPAAALGSGSTRVTRKRTTRKAAPKGSPPPAEAGTRPEAPAGPPLPGEDGYDGPSTQPAPAGAPETPEGGASSDGDDRSEGGRSPSPTGEGDAPPSGADAPGSAEESSPVEAEAGSGAPGQEESESSETTAELGSDSSAPTEDPRDRRPSSRAQHRMIFGQLNELYGQEDVPDEERYLIASTIIGRPIESFTQLTKGDATQIVDTLAWVKDRTALMNLLDTIDQASEEQAAAEAGDES